MRLIFTFIVCVLSLNVSAQLFVGYGGTMSFRERQWVASLSKNINAGYFIRKTEKLSFGIAAIYEQHNYDARLFDESIQKRRYFHIQEYGLTPALFIGQNIDSHLSIGIMAGYEFLLREKHWSETRQPYQLYDSSDVRLKNGRAAFNVYAQIDIFPRHWLSPMLFARYGMLIGNGKPINELALTFCVLYRNKPSSGQK